MNETRDASSLARLLDHSVLKPESTEADIITGADVVRALGIGYYCVQPGWVKLASDALSESNATIVSVVGFPHGCDVARTKALAAELAAADGAREIDMVIDIGALKSGYPRYLDAVRNDVDGVVRAVPGCAVKVIIEAAALTDAEKRLACRLAVDAGAAFVKTSTGFHPAGGAAASDVRLMRECVGPNVGVKASGGVRTLVDVETMLAAGANRIGTSASGVILAAIAR